MADPASLAGLVKGFLVPEFVDERTGLASFANREDVEKIANGYACGNGRCLAEFTTYLPRCPLCGHQRDVAADIGATPKLWQDHYDEARRPGERTVARSMQDTIRDLTSSPDVEHMRLSQLKPSKHGRGR